MEGKMGDLVTFVFFLLRNIMADMIDNI